jgi:hypothetical protein
MESTKLSLIDLSKYHRIVFPEKYYYEGALSFYPIIVIDLDMNDGSLLIEILYHCTPFVEMNYDYLIMINGNKQNTIQKTGLRIPVRFLKEFKTAIDTDDATLLEQLTLPFPQEITTQILECFDHHYEIFDPITTGYEGSDRIAELLWAFSKSQEVLLDDCNTEYRNHIGNNYRTEIINLLDTLKSRINHGYFNEIEQLCDKVLGGQKFDDVDFNIFYSNLISKSLEQTKSY